jgi:endonuclease G
MDEFRIPSHNKRYNRSAANRQVWSVLIGVGVIFLLMYFMLRWNPENDVFDSVPLRYSPEPHKGTVYQKPNFSLSYVEQYELPEWVSYELTVDMMNKPKQKRDQDFEPDPEIKSGSGHYHDYKQSGYRRGHLVPSADMAWDRASMDATFLLSNVAPMREDFNDGIWLELENNVRDWSRKYKRILVVAGPLFRDSDSTIGDNEILVPRYFYKAVFTVKDTTPMVIGFLFDQHQEVFGSLKDYVISIDSLEKETGLDLFANLYGNWDAEINLEKITFNQTAEWPFNDRWYKQRMDNMFRN